MKKVLVIASFFCSVFAAKSQNLTVEGTAPNLYITHTVAPKDNFYSVGRLYNQNPKAIASFNNLSMEKGLAIGQRIKIPLNAQNLDASGSNTGQSIPLTHVVGKSETLSKIGSDLNVSAQTIKQWNNLSSDNLAPGTPLVVGHIKMSSTAGVAKPATTADQPAVAATAATKRKQIDPASEKQEEVAETKQPLAEPKKQEPTTVSQPQAEKKESPAAIKQEQVKQVETAQNTPAKEVPVKQEVVKEPAVKMEQPAKSENYSYASTSTTGSVEGVFANVFTTDVSQKSINNKSGEAATFKSTSGWQDKKYYVLMNDVAPGTIVKIASTDNKLVYAKVLGSMPDMKENNGLLLRISNAAASFLGIIDPKFPVQISYYQ